MYLNKVFCKLIPTIAVPMRILSLFFVSETYRMKEVTNEDSDQVTFCNYKLWNAISRFFLQFLPNTLILDIVLKRSVFTFSGFIFEIQAYERTGIVLSVVISRKQSGLVKWKEEKGGCWGLPAWLCCSEM